MDQRKLLFDYVQLLLRIRPTFSLNLPSRFLDTYTFVLLIPLPACGLLVLLSLLASFMRRRRDSRCVIVDASLELLTAIGNLHDPNRTIPQVCPPDTTINFSSVRGLVYAFVSACVLWLQHWLIQGSNCFLHRLILDLRHLLYLP